MANRFIATLLLLATCFGASADIVTPGHINKQFMFTNLDKFPGFTYSYAHHGYHYNQGYQPSPVDTVAVANNTRYFVSEKGSDQEPLMGRDKSGHYFVSDTKLGGDASVNPSINGMVEVYTIVSIKNGKIKIKKVKEISLYANGKEKVRKSGIGFADWVGSDNFTSGLAIVSAGALLAMLALFLFRRRRPRYIQLTA